MSKYWTTTGQVLHKYWTKIGTTPLLYRRNTELTPCHSLWTHLKVRYRQWYPKAVPTPCLAECKSSKKSPILSSSDRKSEQNHQIICDFSSLSCQNSTFLFNFAAYSERKQALVSPTNHHLEAKRELNKQVKSVAQYSAQTFLSLVWVCGEPVGA